MKSPQRPSLPFCQSSSSLFAVLLGCACAYAACAYAAMPAQARAAAHQKTAAAHQKLAKHRKAAPRTDYVGEAVNFGQWKAVADFADAMVSKHGFDRAELAALIDQVHFVDAAVQLIKPAPAGKPKNWQAYSDLFIEPVRIEAGVKFWNAHAETLARAEADYGVPAEIIVGILGVETVYGRHTGRFRVMDALTTLAFAYPETPNRAARMEFFRGELENTLLLARKYGLDPLALQGSFAGAIGLPQFMPGSILKYGVDFDGDGQVDLRGSAADAIGSVANFLVAHGWQRNERGAIVYAADVAPSRAWEAFIGQGLAAKFRPDELLAAGVVTSLALPDDMLFGLIDLQNGAQATQYWVGTNNFFAITQYNRSYFYAMSVIELGRAVRLTRAI